jgi:hypothetical protein
VSISLPGATAPARTAPTRPATDYRMHTLTVDATNLQGRPDTGDDVFIGNADETARFDGLQETDNFFYRGSTKFSAPAGHYWALATFYNFSGSTPSLRLVVVPQFTLSGRQATLRIAERSASSEVRISVPQKTVDQQTSFEVVRGDAHGVTNSFTNAWSGFNAWVSPTTRAPTVGTLNTYTAATLSSPAKVSPGYGYNLDFPGPPGLVARQHHVVTAADLGAVTDRFYQDVPTSSAGEVTFGGTLAQLAFQLQPILQISMPQVQTQYYQAGRGLYWSLQTLTNLNQFAGGDDDIYRSYASGQRETQNWNSFPLHPAPFTTLGYPAFPTQTSAARAGRLLLLDWTPFSDNQFGHLGPGYFGNGNALVTGSYTVDQDGRQIAHGNAVKGIPAIRLSPRPSTVRFALSADRYSGFFRLSSGSTTVWTWKSIQNDRARVPAAWYCSAGFVGEQLRYDRQCAVQPLMTLSYAVQGMSLTGVTRPGRQVVDVTAGHIQLGGSARITGASAQYSLNDGDTWFPATVTTLGGGRFRVGFSAPAGVDVTLRVRATDAAGGSITETIVRGYGVAK